MARERQNARYLQGVRLPDAVEPVALDLPAQCSAAELIVLALPSRAFASVAGLLAPPARTRVLSLTKGLEPGSARLLLDVLCERAGLAPDRVAVLSGPNHAEEIGLGQPAASVVASESIDTARELQAALTGGAFRVYASTDTVGVQLCAAAKNVIGIAAGASDGLGFGDNAKAALMTRGLAEMARLGASTGADPRTYAGLAGMGDLVATCTSRHSRNRAAGQLLAEGVPADEIEGRIGMVVEGLTTAPSVRSLGLAHGVSLPITEAVCSVLDQIPLREAIAGLLAREPVDEFSGRVG